MKHLKTALIGVCLAVSGCGSTSNGGSDGAVATPDAAVVATADVGTPSDAEVGPPDASEPDAGIEPGDAQAPDPDAGASDAQVGAPDGGPGFVEVTDIRDLQDPTRPTFVPAGTKVRLTGAVVTLTAPSNRTFFFVQNPTGPAEYSGIRVARGIYTGPLPVEGSVVTTLDATVVEAVRGSCGPTETCPEETSLVLAGFSPLATTPGGTVPAPAVVTTTALAANPGAYEGVLVEINGTTAVDVGLLAGEVAVWIEDGLVAFCVFYAPVPPPQVGATITRLVGPVAPYGPLWEIYPRHDTDLVFVDPPADAGVPDGG